MIKLKRVYDTPSEHDGLRVLVDRLWPRGVKKEDAAIDLWLKEIAPSSELRKWFDHDPEKWDEFCRRYMEELRSKRSEIELLKSKLEKSGDLTLVFAAKDIRHNNAVVLKKFMESLIDQD